MRLEEYYILKKIDDEIKDLKLKQEEIYNCVINNTLNIKENGNIIAQIMEKTQERKIGFEE